MGRRIGRIMSRPRPDQTSRSDANELTPVHLSGWTDANEGDRMATKDSSSGGSSSRRPTGNTGRNRNAYCSFCRKSYRDVGPLVEGPGDVYICGECIEL